MHFMKAQETAAGILTARMQELDRSFPGAALRQRCSRSACYVAAYQAHIFLAPRTPYGAGYK